MAMDNVNNNEELNNYEIAVIAMVGRFPGAKDIDEFWQNLSLGVESITWFTDEELLEAGVNPDWLSNPNYVKANAVLSGMELFDANFFGYSAKEAEIVDPQQRLFLESAWTALEQAGYNPQIYKGLIGVYAGLGLNSYLLNNLTPNRELLETVDPLQLLICSDKDFLPMRVAYKLNLTGPAVNVQTACSTSLAAVHFACQSLLNGECDMALAGGVSLSFLENTGYLYQEGMILSPDGHCRAFDANAQGTIGGSGVGIVVLKRLNEALADGDCIQAIIKGSAINNDGALKVGYTAPSINGQAAVIAEAQAVAGVDAETISYIEAHGTGTPLGDPIEIAALTQAFAQSTDKKGFCAIGSVKTNVGHLNAAAGVTGLIKSVMALQHKLLPPSLNFSTPNPKIDFANSPFYVNTTLSEWKTNNIPRRAGVSSFGIGGTNAHVILEEAPVFGQGAGGREQGRNYQLLVLSAKTAIALDRATSNLADHLKQHPELNLADVAYTLSIGRWVFNHRRMVVCQNLGEAVKVLSSLESKQVFSNCTEVVDRSVVFMFPGQGSQYVNMTREIYQTEAIFREQVDLCSEILLPQLGLDLRHLIYPDNENSDRASKQLQQTAIAQPAIFVIEYALTKLWQSYGVNPVAAIGHSIGEYVAACIAGVFSLEDALSLVAARGQMMQQLPNGAMLAIPLPEDRVKSLLGQELSLAAINQPFQCVVSGSTTAVDALENQLTTQGIECRRLHTNHAFHSQMMEPILEAFAHRVKQVTLNPPNIPYISNLTGTWITATQAINPDYYAQHLRSTVLFAQGVEKLLATPEQILLEVGPGRTLTTLAKRHPDKAAAQMVLTSVRHPQEEQSDIAFLFTTLGQLWLAGAKVDWFGFYKQEQHYRLPLPTYPFERQRYWIEPPRKNVLEFQTTPSKKPDIADWFYVPSWKRSPLSVSQLEHLQGSVLLFINECNLGSQLAKELKNEFQKVIVVKIGESFKKENQGSYTLNPRQSKDYETLLAELGDIPKTIVHLWSLAEKSHAASELAGIDQALDLGFYSLLFLAQAFGKQNVTDRFQLIVISNNMQDVTAEEKLRPDQATLIGPVRTIPKEYPYLSCRSVDVVIPQSETWQEKQLIRQLQAELKVKSDQQIIAYRKQHRWVQTFESVRLENSNRGIQRLKEGGVYLITGGLGGIGLALAEYLALTVKVKLILTGRSYFPAQTDWEQWLASHDAQDDTSYKIQKLQAIEKLGTKVLIVNADVTNLEQMQNAIAQALELFGQINGVIHSAGVPGGGVIQLKTPEIAQKVLVPKIRGTLVLDALFKDVQLDFFILCSSLSSILNDFGQVDYCAANAFLDAFAHHKTSENGTFTVSINWDGWQEVGMAAAAAKQRIGTLDLPLTPARIDEREKTFSASQSQNFCLEISSPGILETLRFQTAKRQKPGAGEVEIEIYAAGLNYKEVLLALGMLPVQSNTPLNFGLECAGKIVALGEGVEGYQLGDEVIAFSSSCFSAFTTTSASYVAPKPNHLSLEEAATIPISFMTAYYALNKLGRLCKGESVLIHAAAGGVGMAAIQIAQTIGAEIFVTAGSPEKRAFLHSLGIEYVMDSRSLAFADEVMQYTNGKGIDVVLNSLGGEFIPKSLSILAPYGRFLELGKQNIDENSQVGLRLSEKSLSFFTIDLEPNIPNFSSIFLEVVQHFKNGNFSPLPHQVFPISEVAIAFEYMAQAKHIGKLVVSLQDKEALKKIASEVFNGVRSDHIFPKISQPADSGLYEQAIATTNILHKDHKLGLLPAEGVDVFRRLLCNTLPQVIVSTRDLHSRIEQNQVSTLLSFLEESSKEDLPKQLHQRPPITQAYVVPRNKLEQIIAGIWEDVLGFEQVGIHDDFFMLGGDSLVAVRVMAQIKNIFQAELPLATLLQNPTIAQLSQLLKASNHSTINRHLQKLGFHQDKIKVSDSFSEMSNAINSVLVPIQLKGEQVPLFCVHPVGGNVLCYAALSQQLGQEHPIYGLQSLGLIEQQLTLNTIEAMASHYLEEILTVQPQGPYHLIGWSMGGIISYEIAQQLIHRGETVALLVLIDSHIPTAEDIPGKDQLLVEFIKDLAGQSRQSLHSVLESLEGKLVSLEQVFKLTQHHQLFPSELSLEQLQRLWRVFQVNMLALTQYHPQPYNGAVLSLVASESVAQASHTVSNGGDRVIWDTLIKGELSVHIINGDHFTLMREPNQVAEIAYYLGCYL
ncbi:polyketide synthase [Nostoc sp. 'Peltigera membranacea cyanobiont' N6]|nr:polyketide synthase [Nostoc sp. 'Peltigera membranacea cyanobiont' N6]